ncbi:hypothetical protein E1292_21300 [Nonomuraea deserti]|uniref:Serine/threonine protein kinase n=1 Tax=Nonomuraea deserti TaxID=1848322 RepID=A0A4R4VMG8_9ACTN|nr:hypothetical protein [Nonomuraea deserti]TDD03385.1 hypothetical protein E1292_21300 [Nonomuraea deserti]
MSKRHLAVATAVAAALLAAPLPAEAGSARTLTLRGGLTLRLPATWKVHKVEPGWTRVVTGNCAEPEGGYGTPGCDSFWILGPKAIEKGDELFRPYTGASAFYPATDVQRCPHNGKWGQRLGAAGAKGLRKVGPGHRAAYREWKAACVSYSNGRVRSRYVQREWHLPKTGILVVDQWSTPGLSGVLQRARWS